MGNSNGGDSSHEGEETTAPSSALKKIGAAALMALVAYTLASSPSSPSDDGVGILIEALLIGAVVAVFALLARAAYSLASSLARAAYSLASSFSSHSGDRCSGRVGVPQMRYSPESAGGKGTAAIHRDPVYYAGYSHQQTITIMSYNVCSWEVDHVEKRMEAIGELVEVKRPDLIFFQEVTSSIYECFQKCNWWGSYSCSVPPEKWSTKSFFCMMMSKLHVKRSYYKHLQKTTTGRGLGIYLIDTGGNSKGMVVATCHLKCPYPPKNMHSEERVSQANDAISVLDVARNVVLGGDMNWDEGSDGPFTLLPKWRDAWSTLRPWEAGWTYDTVSNGMLAHSRPLQRRLDRFVCKLNDFEMIGIELVGTREIPGVRNKKLPVFPSDHFGLILTIRPKQQVLVIKK